MILIPFHLSFYQSYEESYNYFKESDIILNKVYDQLITIHKSSSNFIKNLKNSERAWLRYRDAQLELFYPEHVLTKGKDSLSQNEMIHMAYLTKNRTKVLLEMLRPITEKQVYVSDLEVIRSENIHGGLGIDKPYWTSDIVICGRRYDKRIVVHPEEGGRGGYAEFQIPMEGGRLEGIAGWAEGIGSDNYHGKMRYRILVDGKLIYGNELVGKECQGLNVKLGSGNVIRIESDDGGDGNYSDHLAFGDLRIEY